MITASLAVSNAHNERLADRLGALHAERLRTWDPAVLQINIDQRAELVASADPSHWPRVGERLSDVQLIDVETGPFRLYERTAAAPLLLLFFRFAGCPACNIALPYYNETLWPALTARGINLLAISPQRPDRLVEIKQRHQLGFAVATDPDNAFGRRLGITFIANAATQAQRKAGATWIGETTGTGTWELPQPTAVLLDTQNLVRFIDVTPDWMQRTEAQTIIDAVDHAGLGRI